MPPKVEKRINGNNWYPRIQLLRGYSFELAAVFCSEFCLACGRSIFFRVFQASEGKRTRRPEIRLCPQAIFECDTRTTVEGARNKPPPSRASRACLRSPEKPRKNNACSNFTLNTGSKQPSSSSTLKGWGARS